MDPAIEFPVDFVATAENNIPPGILHGTPVLSPGVVPNLYYQCIGNNDNEVSDKMDRLLRSLIFSRSHERILAAEFINSIDSFLLMDQTIRGLVSRFE